MPAVADELPFLQELVAIAQDMLTTLGHRAKVQAPERYMTAFVTKAVRTARGIVVLYQNSLALEAQSLVRILFEVSVSFDAFLHLSRRDPKMACRRVLDSMMLEKIKQQRASGFAGRELVAGTPGQDELVQKELEIASRYSASGLKSLRMNGFSGLSVEDRARQAGCQEYYHIVYRNFSRNVHGSDFAELLLASDVSMLKRRRDDFFESRDGVALDVAFVALWSVVDQVNRGFGLGEETRLSKLAELRRHTRHKP